MARYREALAAEEVVTAANAKKRLEEVTAAMGVNVGKVLQAVRLVITGAGGGPDLMMIMEIIGKDEVLTRIDRALKTLQAKIS